MAMFERGKRCLFSRLKSLTKFQRFNNTLAERISQTQFYHEMGTKSVADEGNIDMSKWKKVDARLLGINRSMISPSSWTVLRVLRNKGFDVYLVGGCVRDLILNKIPKDFDVITTATLKQIKIQFNRALIVGQRFPICRVHIGGSVVEVSSFETVAKRDEMKEEVLPSKVPFGCDRKDFMRWRNSMHRDFTVNSLFFDPFMDKIYDYTNGMADLRSLKLRTLIPADVSFKEDTARILRGLRLAARLGLSFSKDTETAIRNFSSSIESLAKSRIMMEVNYMLSYGAAEPSLYLLWRFNLFESLLPLHAGYLSNHSRLAQSSTMLMKLFSNLDKLASCDRPAGCTLWVGLLAFHLALVINPQEAIVIWTLASVLYHAKWKEGLEFARKQIKMQVNFVPEISGFSDIESDEELANEVTRFAIRVQTACTFSEAQNSYDSMIKDPLCSHSGLAFVSKKTAENAAHIFDVLVNDIESYREGRQSSLVDYYLLRKDDLCETRFTLGKIILETMNGGTLGGGREVENDTNQLQPENTEKDARYLLSDIVKDQLVKKDKKRGLPSDSQSKQEMGKKKKFREKNCINSEHEIGTAKHNALLPQDRWEEARMHRRIVKTSHQSDGEINVKANNKAEKKTSGARQDIIVKKNTVNDGKEQDIVDKEECRNRDMKRKKIFEKAKDVVSKVEADKSLLKCNLSGEEKVEKEKLLEKKDSNVLSKDVVKETSGKCQEALAKEKSSQRTLSSLFRSPEKSTAD